MKTSKKIISIALAALMLLSTFAGLNIVAFADGYETEIISLEKNGWYKEGSQWVYFVNGEYASGWKKIDGKWYYFSEEEHYMYCQTPVTTDGKVYLLGKSGALVTQTGWHKEVYDIGYGSKWTEWYYVKSTSGELATGWKKLSNKWYYLDTEGGFMRTGSTEIDGKLYAFDYNGAMITGWGQGPWGEWYYAKSSGILLTSWQKIGNKWYYFDTDGTMVTFVNEINGKKYLFDGNGAWVKNPSNGWHSAEITARNAYNNTTYTYTEWCYVKDGKFVDGWLKLSGKWYYFTEYNHMITGQFNVDGVSYFFESSGALRSKAGWVQAVYSDGTKAGWYYTDKNGVCKTGWIKSGGKWYYLDTYDGEMVQDYPQNVDGVVYLLGKDGAWIKTAGWYQDSDDDWYYVRSDGTCETGWFDWKGNTYFFDTDLGYMYYNGTYYTDSTHGNVYFDENGHAIIGVE